jgi:hypothetical protein
MNFRACGRKRLWLKLNNCTFSCLEEPISTTKKFEEGYEFRLCLNCGPPKYEENVNTALFSEKFNSVYALRTNIHFRFILPSTTRLPCGFCLSSFHTKTLYTCAVSYMCHILLDFITRLMFGGVYKSCVLLCVTEVQFNDFRNI